MEDSMFPDVPETPAPIFAYRALKGFIFGSPNDDDNSNNKENIAQPKTSAQKPQLFAKPDQAQNLTPQKRKRAADYVLSPVKSILRPSGVATPRALQLQQGNVGVTFKDIRKSMSPEGKVDRKRQDITKKNPSRQSVLERGVGATLVEKPKPTVLASERMVVKSNRVRSSQLATPLQRSNEQLQVEKAANTAATPTETAPFDFDAYMRQTEKEMKKLVRYNQKLREYARKQDEENTKLRLALDECRRENERLTQAEESRQRQTERLDSAAHCTREVGVRQEGGDQERSKDGYKTSNPSEAVATGRTLMRAGISLGGGAQPPNQQPGPELFDLGEPVNENGGGAVQHRKQPQQHQSNARLPPDRVAAARERIRMKAAKRKASEISQVD